MKVSEALSFWSLSYLTFQSVLQVVLVAFAGFWCAHSGLLPKQGQKIISLLNVDLFTPCLIFSKLAKSLSIAKIFEIAVIPVFYAVSTGISYLSGRFLSWMLDLDIDETNFVIANAVFGNSNSLPVSLTLSLAYTLPGLEWDQIPNDTRDSIASRGILYLLIWQQIGQVLRWTWGYNKLMKWSGGRDIESRDVSAEESQSTAVSVEAGAGISVAVGGDLVAENDVGGAFAGRDGGNVRHEVHEEEDDDEDEDEYVDGGDPSASLLGRGNRRSNMGEPMLRRSSSATLISLRRFKDSLVGGFTKVRDFMNPPLYSMLLAVIVASIHPLQHELFHANGFINNTVSGAIEELGSLSVPLILVVLGSNLYPSTDVTEKSRNYNKLVGASIVGRMIFPSFILLPLLALCVKFINVSILDDPIFLVVGFILTVAPPAIQLTQITQLNEFFESEMAGVLFWSYVVLSLPVSIVVVAGSISVLRWAE